VAGRELVDGPYARLEFAEIAGFFSALGCEGVTEDIARWLLRMA
jgi:hypothetical protein